MARVLVICPTFDHADALYFSIASLRAQTYSDWTLTVIGDGAPDKTRRMIAAMADQDDRISASYHPKSIRFGEEHRDQAIRASDAELICHLSDDDLWAPDHLANMVRLLEVGDWVNQAPMRIEPDGRNLWWPVNHGTAAIRTGVSCFFGPSVGLNYAAYRKSAYLSLQQGWSTAPMEIGPSDRYNWSNFAHAPEISIASQAITSALKFPSHVKDRAAMLPEARGAELGPWLARVGMPGLVDHLRETAEVGARFLQLFHIHGAWDAPDLNTAMSRCGMEIVPFDVTPDPAMNGAPMQVPLNQAQCDQANAALARTQRLNALPDGFLDENQLESVLGQGDWLGVAVGMAQKDPEKAVRYLKHYQPRFENKPHYWSLRVGLECICEQFACAEQSLADAGCRWPNGAWIELLKSRLETARAPLLD